MPISVASTLRWRMGIREWRKSIVRFWKANFQIMSDTKVLRLVKKTEGELPEKAFTAQAVAAPEPKRELKPASESKPAPVTAIKFVPRRGSAKPQQKPRLSREEMLKIFRTMYLSRRLDDK